MNRLTDNNIISVFFSIIIVLMYMCVTHQALAISFFGSDDDETLWKSGRLLYIKLAEQDEDKDGKAQPNDHPVTLDNMEITNALNLIEFREKTGFFKGKEEKNTVFSLQQARLLGQYLSEGLAKAKPDQDIIFVMTRLQKLTLGLKDTVYVAGRAFYKDKRLHIIIGDYDRPPDKGLEAAAGGFGITEIDYFFTHGRRGKASGFDKNLAYGNGVEAYRQGKKLRRDWLVVDVATASKTYIAKNKEKEEPSGTVDSEAIRIEAAKMAKERREMRAEMARMRKEMKDNSNGNAGVSAETVEERISTLDRLLEKDLITRDEYEARRKAILNEI